MNQDMTLEMSVQEFELDSNIIERKIKRHEALEENRKRMKQMDNRYSTMSLGVKNKSKDFQNKLRTLKSFTAPSIEERRFSKLNVPYVSGATTPGALPSMVKRHSEFDGFPARGELTLNLENCNNAVVRIDETDEEAKKEGSQEYNTSLTSDDDITTGKGHLASIDCEDIK